MKKLLVMMFLFLSFMLFGSDGEYVVHIGECNYHNSITGFTESQYAIKYDEENNRYYLAIFSSNSYYRAWIILDDLDKLKSNLAKFFEWDKLANEKQIKLDKELTESAIITKMIWYNGDDWFYGLDFELYFSFFSRGIGDNELVICSNKVSDRDNEYMTYQMDDMYLTKDQLILLSDGISDNNIAKAKKVYEDKLKEADMFK